MRGTVRLIFQPAEEGGAGGLAMVQVCPSNCQYRRGGWCRGEGHGAGLLQSLSWSGYVPVIAMIQGLSQSGRLMEAGHAPGLSLSLPVQNGLLESLPVRRRFNGVEVALRVRIPEHRNQRSICSPSPP